MLPSMTVKFIIYGLTYECGICMAMCFPKTGRGGYRTGCVLPMEWCVLYRIEYVLPIASVIFAWVSGSPYSLDVVDI